MTSKLTFSSMFIKKLNLALDVHSKNSAEQYMCHIPLPVKQETVSAFLIRTGRKVFNIKGDGNCLFRALSHQLFGTEDHHLSLRTSLVRYELFNKQHFQGYLIPPHDRKDISSHAIYMSAPDVWGTQVVLKAAATMFGLPIYFLEKSARGYEWKVIHSLKDRSFLTLPQLTILDELTVPTTLTHIELLYSKNVHFDSVVHISTEKTSVDAPELSESIGVTSRVELIT